MHRQTYIHTWYFLYSYPNQIFELNIFNLKFANMNTQHTTLWQHTKYFNLFVKPLQHDIRHWHLHFDKTFNGMMIRFQLWCRLCQIFWCRLQGRIVKGTQKILILSLSIEIIWFSLWKKVQWLSHFQRRIKN